MLNYSLPKERIALRPAEPRDSSRLMVIHRKPGTVPFGDSPQSVSHRIFRDLPDLLKQGDCLVLNDTKVLPARIYGRKAITGGKVELLLLQQERGTVPFGDSPPKCAVYRCLGQSAKNLKPGTRLQFDNGSLQAEVLAWEEGERLVRFEGRGVEQALARLGEMPLPPYIDRPVEPRDADWYQTVFAREAGAVAAPTAGLHFTPELLARLKERGVRVAYVTLHVGWGTFKPVGEKELAAGKLHPERFQIPAETAEAIQTTKANDGRVIAVGTTVVRALETFALRQAQDERTQNETMALAGDGEPAGHVRRPSGHGVAERFPGRDERGRMPSEVRLAGADRAMTSRVSVSGLSGVTEIFIRPGFKFKVVDALVTNFHLPGTSLLLLVSAFAGEERIQAAYQEAIQKEYRFYSYGDAMVIL